MGRLLAALASNSLRQQLISEVETDLVMTYIRELGEPVVQAENKEQCGNRADGYTEVTLFGLHQGGTADGCAFCHDFGRDTPTPTSITDVVAQLT